MVGEAYAYVQDASLKAYAAFLCRLLNSPIARAGVRMHVLKMVLAVIGGFTVLLSSIWLVTGKSAPDKATASPKELVISATANEQGQSRPNPPEAPLATCDAAHAFHLERLKASPHLKVILLGPKGVANVQSFLNLSMQNPPSLSDIPRLEVWVAWLPAAHFEGTPSPPGVIDIVQDGCVLYRRQGEAEEVVAIANGNWSR
jgi:hypothetical protein